MSGTPPCPPDDAPFADAEALQRGVEYCRNAHRRALASPRAARWDYCVLTAANARQAEAYRRELAARDAAGLIPLRTRVRVCTDPGGHRVGSGGATLYALREIVVELLRDHERDACDGDTDHILDAADLFRGKRILVLHAGGDSRRLPHCSASGKVLAPLPLVLPGGQVATVLDLLLTNLFGLASRCEEGLLVASGDVVITLDPRRLNLKRRGVVGVSANVAPEQASNHGVYLTVPRGRQVASFLQKPTVAQMSAAGCVSSLGLAQVDTGLLKFDLPTMGALLEMAGVSLARGGRGVARLRLAPAPLGAESPADLSVDIYREIACALPAETTREQYFAALGEQPSGSRAAAASIWECLRERRDTHFHAEKAEPTLFTHIGSTAAYLATVTSPSLFAHLYGFTESLGSYLAPGGRRLRLGDGARLFRSVVCAEGSAGADSVIVDSHLHGSLRTGEGSIVSGVNCSGALVLPGGTVLHCLPVCTTTNGDAQRREVALVFGTADDPKLDVANSRCRFLGKPLSAWLSRRGVPSDAIWDDGAPETLWEARLFPIGEADSAWRHVLWMLEPRAALEVVADWLAQPRTSMREAVEMADLEAIEERRSGLDTLRHCLVLGDAAGADVDVRPLVHQLTTGAAYDAVVRSLLARADATESCLERARLLQVAADTLSSAIPADSALCSEDVGCPDLATAGSRLSQRAFDCVRDEVGTYLRSAPPARDASPYLEGWVAATCPVRADFAGGWSDTPPSSLERGGTVLNAAVTLGGEPPLRVWGRRISEPILRLASRDRRQQAAITDFRGLYTYHDPLQPLGIHKAAFAAAGIVPERCDGELSEMLVQAGGGFELITDSQVPCGSGVGASSILAAGVLATVAKLSGCDQAEADLITRVLYLEQILSTGGGWQDQVGGIVGGVKLTRSFPEAPLDLQIERLALAPAVVSSLQERLVLFYTGRTRLARNLLQTVMRRYLSREARFMRANRAIQDIAVQMRDALLAGDVDEFGWLMWMHWELLKIIVPESTTTWIERLLDEAEPYIVGAKMLGAGGGGFMVLVAKEGHAGPLRQRLGAVSAGTAARVYDFRLSDEGLNVGPCSEGDVPGYVRRG